MTSLFVCHVCKAVYEISHISLQSMVAVRLVEVNHCLYGVMSQSNRIKILTVNVADKRLMRNLMERTAQG